MIDRVAETIARYAMRPGNQRIGIAVSGGADSLFLLHALHELGIATAVLHINHGLRVPDSDLDEAFVHTQAARLALPFHCLNATPAPGNLEQEARRARYDFFARHIAAGTCDLIATGHTLDDQAETVLYRFLRGSGTAGLSGIRPVTHSGIIRPLIESRAAGIRAWLAARNIAWREDHSNQNPDFHRNRIRLDLMPRLSATLNPALPELLASTAAWARAEEDYWTAELTRLAPLYLIENAETILISTARFHPLPVALQRRLLRHAIERLRGSLRSIDFPHVESIRALMSTTEGSGRLQLPGLDVYRSFDWLRLGPLGIDTRLERDFESPLAIPGRTRLPERHLTLDMELVNVPRVYNVEMEALDWERCTGSLSPQHLRLRNWRPGDRYQPQGRSSAEKIKTLFQEFRVPLWERRTWPVVTISTETGASQIVWSRKFGVAAEFASGPESRKVLMIREVMESNQQAAASIEGAL